MQRIISQLIVLLFAVSGIQFAQGASDRAYAVANSKAHFLRCGTKHPTAAEARELVERFHSWKQANAKKPTSNPGNGNGRGGGYGSGSGSGPDIPGPGTIIVDVYLGARTDIQGTQIRA